MKRLKYFEALDFFASCWRAIRYWLVCSSIALILMHALTGCNTHSGERPARIANHSFSFAPQEGVEILEFRYGEGKGVARSSDIGIQQFGRSPQQTGISGAIPVGDSLYVKWRDKATTQEYQDIVDLRARLPSNMDDQRIEFMIQNNKLYVYLIDFKTLNPKDTPIVGPYKVQPYKTRQIYPQ